MDLMSLLRSITNANQFAAPGTQGNFGDMLQGVGHDMMQWSRYGQSQTPASAQPAQMPAPPMAPQTQPMMAPPGGKPATVPQVLPGLMPMAGPQGLPSPWEQLMTNSGGSLPGSAPTFPIAALPALLGRPMSMTR